MNTIKFNVGEKIICVNAGLLPGREKGPKLEADGVYRVLDIHTEPEGFQHLHVGLISHLEYITSQDTGRELPNNGYHWCHPSRFKHHSSI